MQEYGLKDFKPPVFRAGCIDKLVPLEQADPAAEAKIAVIFEDGTDAEIPAKFAEFNACDQGSYLVFTATGDIMVDTAEDFPKKYELLPGQEVSSQQSLPLDTCEGCGVHEGEVHAANCPVAAAVTAAITANTPVAAVATPSAADTTAPAGDLPATAQAASPASPPPAEPVVEQTAAAANTSDAVELTNT